MKRQQILSVTFWAALAAPVAFFLGKALAPGAGLYTDLLAPKTIEWIAAVPKLLFLFLAALVAADVARRFEAGNPSRPAWRLMAAGLLGLSLGQAGLTFLTLIQSRKDVFPSFADVFFVAGSLAVVAALVGFLKVYKASGFPLGGPWELRVVAGLAALVAAGVILPLLWPIFKAPAPAAEKLLNLAYPTLDFLMLIPAVLLLSVSLRFWGGRVWPVWGALTAGILFTAVADILFGYFSGLDHTQLESLVDAMYILSYGCFMGSVLYQRELLRPEAPAAAVAVTA
ncbi:MAG TPA: hypothetical protein VF789_11740 [Thermoanaerobaculia bacterium]